MMIVLAGVKVHLALGHTDMRKGLDGLAMLVQATLKQDPFSGHLFAFRGKKASLWVPAQLRVVRITRPKYACRACETVAQVAAPERLIAGGLATPALLAQVLVSKYCDHIAALPAIADLRPAWCRSGALDAGWMGRRRMLVAGSSARAAGEERVRLQPSVRRRHTGAGTRSGPWADQDGAVVGLCP